MCNRKASLAHNTKEETTVRSLEPNCSYDVKDQIATRTAERWSRLSFVDEADHMSTGLPRQRARQLLDLSSLRVFHDRGRKLVFL